MNRFSRLLVTIPAVVLFALMSACTDSPTQPEAEVGRAKKLYADGDCSWSPNCGHPGYESTPWLLEQHTTSAPFPYAWWNSTIENVCTFAGCRQDCWEGIARCTAIFPPIDGQVCTITICGYGGDNGEPPCDYLNPPPGGCDKKLTKRDTTILIKALSVYGRTTFSDTAAARQCGELKTKLLDDIRSPFRLLSRGVNNDPASVGGTPIPHWGASYGVAHLDPRTLDQALAKPSDASRQRRLLEAALHEYAHLDGHDHNAPGEHPSTGYTSAYFKYLNNPADNPLPANSNSCIVW